ncbi:MAG: YARHG domain-containing protein [Crocinitomicaceae bacterium]|nr:YARHG domain-containing protein [Crocinitomicaceae bacterium]
MKRISYVILIALLASGCNAKIKDSEAKIEVEAGTEATEENLNVDHKKGTNSENKGSVLGSWVGYFEEDGKDDDYSKDIFVDEGFHWNRANKINISIDKITDETVTGHSVVAGNHRPFSGKITDGVFILKEPGDDKYDGEFKFQIIDDELIGKWTAYKKINIQKRKYTLERKDFVYNPDILLEKSQRYVDWNKYKKRIESAEIEGEEFEDWVSKEFSSATDLIYTINASNTILQKKDVENLKKGDLTIIRNTIYARHGYSFKSRPLRVFFDAQSWYIPIHTDIKSEFTELEKENIKLLLRYEKNAKEYYDYFGRG